jgi:hypothetical protein
MMRFPNSSHNAASIGSLAVRRVHNEALLEWMQRFLIKMPASESADIQAAEPGV